MEKSASDSLTALFFHPIKSGEKKTFFSHNSVGCCTHTKVPCFVSKKKNGKKNVLSSLHTFQLSDAKVRDAHGFAKTLFSELQEQRPNLLETNELNESANWKSLS